MCLQTRYTEQRYIEQTDDEKMKRDLYNKRKAYNVRFAFKSSIK